MTPDGLYFTDPTRDDANPEWVCQEFSVLGECENGMGGDWGVVMSWQDAAEHRHTWIVPCEMFHGEPHVFPRICIPTDYGAAIPRRHKAICGVVWHRCDPDADLRPSRLRRLAWHELHSGGWHRVGDGDMILRPEMVRADLSCASWQLAEWQDQVAKYALGNSRLALFLSAGFAGALLEIIAEPCGGLHLHGNRRPASPRRHLSPRQSWAKAVKGRNLINGGMETAGRPR